MDHSLSRMRCCAGPPMGSRGGSLMVRAAGAGVARRGGWTGGFAAPAPGEGPGRGRRGGGGRRGGPARRAAGRLPLLVEDAHDDGVPVPAVAEGVLAEPALDAETDLLVDPDGAGVVLVDVQPDAVEV